MGIKRLTFYYQAKDNQDKEQHEVFIKDKIKDISYQHPPLRLPENNSAIKERESSN